ncbi:uncharacterized protein EHS24_005806 [Apiotrichum porosum]|uniref:Uncharacterized protein n=1 Tax=Apiotrichum porosum TaxID=105984 RepID=A0A427XZN5_9TREE|nr:uncharacterized protein EHS24_005806 [Apiotrichum porosum]RSH84291.1 hypothetical protein EHS24_005806 [Apiotrichum porosum]
MNYQQELDDVAALEDFNYVAKYGVHPPNAGDNAAAAAASSDDSDDDGNDDNSNGSIALPTLSEDENVRLVGCFQIKENPKVSGEFAAFVVTLVQLLKCPDPLAFARALARVAGDKLRCDEHGLFVPEYLLFPAVLVAQEEQE